MSGAAELVLPGVVKWVPLSVRPCGPYRGRRRSRDAGSLGSVRNLVCGAIVTPMEGAYAGGYDAVRRYAQREHTSQTVSAFVPLSFAPGEAYEFNRSHEIVLLNGVTVTVKVPLMRLCHNYFEHVRRHGARDAGLSPLRDGPAQR
jgi:hypothetical protein